MANSNDNNNIYKLSSQLPVENLDKSEEVNAKLESSFIEPMKPVGHSMSTANDQPTNIFSRFIQTMTWEPKKGEKLEWYLFFKHRYFRTFAFLLMCLMNTLVYYGWQPFSMMLYRSGAYQWQCTPEEIAAFPTPYSYCDSQGDSVQALFNIGLCAEFMIGVVAGASLDHLGPWLTGFFGCCSFFSGWMLFAYSSESAPMYIPAMILLAGAVNMIAFPCLILGDLFPSRSGLAISLVVAAQTTGTAVAPIMKAVWDAQSDLRYQDIVWGYLGVSFFPVTCIYLLAVPWKRIIFTKSDATLVPQNLDDSAETAATTEPEPLDISISSKIHPPTFLSQISSLEYILFTTYYVLQLLQFGYYPNTVLDQYGEDVANMQGYILPTQGLFGAIFGLLVDNTRTLPVCVALIIMMTGAYICAMIRSVGLQYFTSVLYVISNSYIYTVKYTYVAELYPPTHFGVLIGLIGCVAGALSLVNIPIQNMNQYSGTCVAYIIVGCIAMVIVIFLSYRQKKGITYNGEVKQLPDREEEKSESQDL